MSAKGVLAVIVLCYASVAFAADTVPAGEPEGRAIIGAAGVADAASPAKADQRLFASEGTQITVSTETLSLGVLLLGLIALAIVVLPLLLGGGEEATATAYTAPSTYAQDPYSARSIASSTFNVFKALDKAAAKYL